MDTQAVDFHPSADVADMVDDEPVRVVIEGRQIALYRLGDDFYATDDRCSHGLASLAMGIVDGDRIECPLHGGMFEIKTGKAVKLPCTEDIRTFPVRTEGGKLYVGVPR